VDNGLLLRADLHQLFDRGYVTVTPDHRVEVSHRIQAEFDNGDDYLALHGTALQSLPDAPDEQPSEPFLQHHNEQIYVG
jgi:putative restriction endonuclease